MSDEKLCGAHSGQDEKIRSAFSKVNLLVWLIGIMIGVILTVGAALYSSIQAVQVALAGSTSRVSGIEEKIRSLEGSISRANDRMDRIERR